MASLRERFREVEEIFVEVKGQLMGKIGIGLILFFVVVSIYALVAVPRNFPDLWNNVKYWEKYPKTVPPSWVSHFGVPVAPFVDVVLSNGTTRLYLEPKQVGSVTLFGVVQTFSFNYTLPADAFPQGVLIYAVNVTNETLRTPRGPLSPKDITVIPYVFLYRPDGLVLLLNSPDPVTLADLAKVRKPIRFSDKTVGLQLVEYYNKRGINMTQTYAQNNAARLAFGEYDPDTGKIKPLKGTYTIEVVFTYLARGVDPRLLVRGINAGTVGVQSVEGVVQGSAYGLMGTDDKGRDLYEALLYAFPIELLIGFVAAVLNVVIGVVVGVVSGYYGGWVDEVIQRTIDIISNIPVLPILVLIGAALQREGVSGWGMLWVIILFLVILGWGYLALVVRSMTLSIKSEPYIDAAKAIGASNARIILRHVLPQIIPYAMAALVFNVPGAILTEAGLSVLGIRHNLPTWGTVLALARDYISSGGGNYNIWWWILPPGLLMGLMSVAFVFLGLAMETVVEPRLKRM